MADEGLGMSAESEEDPIDSICRNHAVLTQAEQVEEEDSPALQDVLMTKGHLHLPGIEEVEALALLLLELADNSDLHLVPGTPETRAAQKTKFGWMRYPQAAQVTEDSRLLYLLIKMASIKGQYQRITDRLRDDPILCGLAIPLPNLNAKSISTFIAREEKKANYRATVMPKVTPHQKVLSETPLPEAPVLPTSLPTPDRPQVQYQHLHHLAGKRQGEKWR